MDVDKTIGEHYGRAGLEESILAGLASLGRDIDDIDPEDLAAVDELHVGGADVVRDLARDAGIEKGSRVLDVGSGLGGPARQYGAIVDGIDLTPGFVSTATSLTRRSGLAGLVTFTLGSALDLPLRGRGVRRRNHDPRRNEHPGQISAVQKRRARHEAGHEARRVRLHGRR